MAAMEGVEDIPVLFVAWNQPDVFKLGTSFKFQYWLESAQNAKGNSILLLKSILTLNKWLHGPESLRGETLFGMSPACGASIFRLYISKGFVLEFLFFESYSR